MKPETARIVPADAVPRVGMVSLGCPRRWSTPSAVEKGIAVGRSSADAPEIDGVVYIENGGNLRPGEFCDVAVTGAGTHDLRAVVKAAPADPAARTA